MGSIGFGLFLLVWVRGFMVAVLDVVGVTVAVVRSTCQWWRCFVLVAVTVKGVGNRPAIFCLSSFGQGQVRRISAEYQSYSMSKSVARLLHSLQLPHLYGLGLAMSIMCIREVVHNLKMP